MTKTIEVPCGKCGKIIHAVYEHDAYNPCPVEWLDKLSRCLACDECLLKERRMTVKEYHEGKQITLLPFPKHHEPPKESGLPYRD